MHRSCFRVLKNSAILIFYDIYLLNLDIRCVVVKRTCKRNQAQANSTRHSREKSGQGTVDKLVFTDDVRLQSRLGHTEEVNMCCVLDVNDGTNCDEALLPDKEHKGI